MIQAINLTKRYEDGLLALDTVNFEIRPGEVYCLLGANGAGKTTTINLFLNFIEPTSGLDPKAAAEFMELLRKLKAQGKAVLMSTHDIFRTKEIADRVGILKEGRLVMERSREELLLEDLERLYLDYMQAGVGAAAA